MKHGTMNPCGPTSEHGKLAAALKAVDNRGRIISTGLNPASAIALIGHAATFLGRRFQYVFVGEGALFVCSGKRSYRKGKR